MAIERSNWKIQCNITLNLRTLTLIQIKHNIAGNVISISSTQGSCTLLCASTIHKVINLISDLVSNPFNFLVKVSINTFSSILNLIHHLQDLGNHPLYAQSRHAHLYHGEQYLCDTCARYLCDSPIKATHHSC